MIRPILPKVTSGTRLTTDLVNDIINRTEYAADLLRQYKLIAGNQMYIEPHYDGTRVSYFSPVGGGVNPVVPLPVYKYRINMLLSQRSIILNSGGPSYLSFQVLLERYTGTGTNADPIVIHTWKTPENYTLQMSPVNPDTFQPQFLSVTGQIVEILSPSVLLAKQSGSPNFLFFLRDAASNIISLESGGPSYPYVPTINITNISFPIGLTNARLIFDYYIGPVVDFSPVEVGVSMLRTNPDGSNEFVSQTFNISPASFFQSGTFVSNSVFDTTRSGQPNQLRLFVNTYFKSTGQITVNPN